MDRKEKIRKILNILNVTSNRIKLSSINKSLDGLKLPINPLSDIAQNIKNINAVINPLGVIAQNIKNINATINPLGDIAQSIKNINGNFFQQWSTIAEMLGKQFDYANQQLINNGWFPNNETDFGLSKLSDNKYVDKIMIKEIGNSIVVYQKKINSDKFNSVLSCYKHKLYYPAICTLYTLIDTSLVDIGINQLFWTGDKNTIEREIEKRKEIVSNFIPTYKEFYEAINSNKKLLNGKSHSQHRGKVLHGGLEFKDATKTLFLKVLSLYFILFDMCEHAKKKITKNN